MYDIEGRLPTPEECLALRRAVGWKVPTSDEARRALVNSLSGAVTVANERVVGSGRLVGDGTFHCFVVDLMVSPERQGRGVGRRLLAELEGAAAGLLAAGALQLVADDAATPFYEHLGYDKPRSVLLQKRLPPAST